MRLAQGNHKDALSVLRNFGVISGIKNSDVGVVEPVASSLDFGLDAFECAAFVVGFEVLYVLKQKHLRLVRSKLLDDSYDM